LNISAVIPFLALGFLIVHSFYHSSDLIYLNSQSSGVFGGRVVLSLTCLWQLLSSSSLSSGVMYSSMSLRVSFVSFVSEPSGFRSVVICMLFFFFPAASLYTAFQGLASVVKLQYSFHDLGFLFLLCLLILIFDHGISLSFSLFVLHCLLFFGIFFL